MTGTAELREGKRPTPSLPATGYGISSTMSQIPNPKVSVNSYEALRYTQILWKRYPLFPKDL